MDFVAIKRLVRASLAAALLAVPGVAAARGGKIALTFDDLPALTILPDQPYVDYLNATILRKLRRHHLRAIGFVNQGKVEELVRDRQVANLERWLKAGMDLGNHTFSHESANAIGATAYIADIVRGEPVIRRLLAERGRRIVWFRHPYLETGYPPPAQREIDGRVGSDERVGEQPPEAGSAELGRGDGARGAHARAVEGCGECREIHAHSDGTRTHPVPPPADPALDPIGGDTATRSPVACCQRGSSSAQCTSSVILPR